MTIDKGRIDASLKRVRGLYRDHARGELGPSGFIMKARAEFHAAYMQYTRELIEATASEFIDELHSFQAQFGMDFECHTSILQVARGYRGIRPSIYIRDKAHMLGGSAEIFIGPFDAWDRVATHTIEEHRFGNRPSLYTKRKSRRWRTVQEFDFPAFLQEMREEAERRMVLEDDEDEIPF